MGRSKRLYIFLQKMSTDREYKKYSSLIEKHLESFESTVNEWHDFINFIQKLKQVSLFVLQYK